MAAAHRTPDEGADLLLALLPAATGTLPATLWLGFYTDGDGTTPPGASAVLSTGTGVTEVTGDGYARVAVTGASWAAAGPSGAKAMTVAVQSPTVGASGWGDLTGVFLADAATDGHAVFYATFDDTTPVTPTEGQTVTVNVALVTPA